MTKRQTRKTERPILRLSDFWRGNNSTTPVKIRMARIALKIENKGIFENHENNEMVH